MTRIWPALGKQEQLFEVILDELVGTAAVVEPEAPRFRRIVETAMSMASVSFRAKVLHRLRKVNQA